MEKQEQKRNGGIKRMRVQVSGMSKIHSIVINELRITSKSFMVDC